MRQLVVIPCSTEAWAPSAAFTAWVSGPASLPPANHTYASLHVLLPMMYTQVTHTRVLKATSRKVTTR